MRCKLRLLKSLTLWAVIAVLGYVNLAFLVDHSERRAATNAVRDICRHVVRDNFTTESVGFDDAKVLIGDFAPYQTAMLTDQMPTYARMKRDLQPCEIRTVPFEPEDRG